MRGCILLMALTLACQPRPKPSVGANSAPAARPSADSGAPKLADFGQLDIGVAFHLGPDEKTIEDFSLQISGPPDRQGRCPSCLDVAVTIDGQPFRPPHTQTPQRRCTLEQPNRRVRFTHIYPRCSASGDAFVRFLDPALIEARRADATTTFRVSDGTTTFEAKFLNLFAARDVLLKEPKDGVLHWRDTVELTLSPETDVLDTVSGFPTAEVRLPDGGSLDLSPSDVEGPGLLQFGNGDAWLLTNRPLQGPATLIVRRIRPEVRVATCSGPRFCTAVVPYSDEKRIPVTLAPGVAQ